MKLRPMTMDDADKMLEFKNYEETRKFAIRSHDEIKREDHYAFLEKNLDQFQVVQTKDAIAGAVRVNGGEVSIWIDRAFRANGIALKTINQISYKGMIARIVDGNVASMRVFCRAGFLPKAHDRLCGTDHYIFEKP